MSPKSSSFNILMELPTQELSCEIVVVNSGFSCFTGIENVSTSPIKAWVFPLDKFITTSHLTVLFHLDAFDPVLAFLHIEVLQLV